MHIRDNIEHYLRHVRRRLRERYGLELDRHSVIRINIWCERSLEQRMDFINILHTNKDDKVLMFNYMGTIVIGVYSSKLRVLKTVLPRCDSDFNSCNDEICYWHNPERASSIQYRAPVKQGGKITRFTCNHCKKFFYFGQLTKTLGGVYYCQRHIGKRLEINAHIEKLHHEALLEKDPHFI